MFPFQQQQPTTTNSNNNHNNNSSSNQISNKSIKDKQQITSYLQSLGRRKKRRLKIDFLAAGSHNNTMIINERQYLATTTNTTSCHGGSGETTDLTTISATSILSASCCHRYCRCSCSSSAKNDTMSHNEQILNQIYTQTRRMKIRARCSMTCKHRHHRDQNQQHKYRPPSLALFANSPLTYGVILSTLMMLFCCYIVLVEANNESHEHNQQRVAVHQQQATAAAATSKLLEPKAEALRSNNNNNGGSGGGDNDKYHHQQQQQHNHHHHQQQHYHQQPQQDSTLPTTTTSTPTNNNVIIIKYANVSSEDLTRTTGESDSATQDGQTYSSSTQLNVFKLYEPLSVAVIESKFANSIQLFDVSHNQLSTLSKDLFCPLSNEVRQLNISHNLLENFDCLGLISQAGQLCLSELRILDMSYNLIKHLPATGVATLHNLEILNLSNNLIESLDELSLSSLFKLTKLDLSANRIQQLPSRIFHKSTSMQVLKLQSNFIETSVSPMLLSGLISLEELNLSYNNISHVSDYAFLDKVNLTIVNLTFNQLSSLRQEALRVTSVKQAVGYRHRLHHNGQYAGIAPKQAHSQSVSAEFLLSSNPYICDCQLDWLRKFQPSAIRRTVLTSANSNNNNNNNYNNRMQDTDFMLADQAQDQLSSQLMQLTSSSNRNHYQNDQPAVILTSSSASVDSSTTNNISETLSNQQLIDSTAVAATNQHQASNRPMATLLTNGGASQTANNNQQAHVTQHYARIGDLDLIKCTPLFRRNSQRYNQHQNYHHEGLQQHRGSITHSRSQAPSDGSYHSHTHHQFRQTDAMIDLMTADSSNFLCRYKSHCFALCHCCEFDACDCEMICPTGCNCYYDSTWQTNIIDCSSNNHTVVPDRIPMDVSGLYLDGNNIDSLKPSNLIARKSLKTLYLNSSNLQYIANRTFNGLIELQTLYLHDNMLRSLNGYEFEPLAQLRALYLQSNRLDHISNQTFIYLRSLEILDLSNNRLTSTNLDLFWSIGHHNIRLRQLNIAHNWWSCQCNSINRFRQILTQKFLLNGGVNIGDKNQLRCYYNSTTVGPLILTDGSSSSSLQPVYATYPISSNQRQQTQLTEINQCSEMIEDRRIIDVNPPLIQAVPEPPSNTPPNDFPSDPFYPPEPFPSNPIPNPYGPLNPPDLLPGVLNPPSDIEPPMNRGSGQRFNTNGMPLTSFILLSVFMAGVFIVVVIIFLFFRQQQSFHQNHHKKSSAASTTSASSSASSTAISSLNGKSANRGVHDHLHHHTLHSPHHHHHLIMSDASGGANTTNISHHLNHPTQHQHSASSQSNIYAALVSPTTGNSTNVNNATNMNINNNATNINSNLYSNSSTSPSHRSSSSQNGLANGYPQHWSSQNQPFYNHQSLYGGQAYTNGMGAIENHYTINASSQASYKAGSLYNAPNNYLEASSNLGAAHLTQNDWIKLPKVKQFMSKLVNKSLALGGYRSCSRDELSAIASDKIYDAFISYDKRDEGFVMQHLSAELEYGQPQYR